MENSKDREVLFSRENEEKQEFLSIQKAPPPNLSLKYAIRGSIDFAQIVNQNLTYLERHTFWMGIQCRVD